MIAEIAFGFLVVVVAVVVDVAADDFERNYDFDVEEAGVVDDEVVVDGVVGFVDGTLG